MTSCTGLYPCLGYSFKDESLLKQALTLGFGDHFSGYERLEFLGDRVLGVIVAHMLYRHFPHEPEGDLAKRFSDLTRAETLAAIARDLHFSRYLISAAPSNKPDLTKAVLSDVCEAVIAALFLDGGFEAAQRFVVRYWENRCINSPLRRSIQKQSYRNGRRPAGCLCRNMFSWTERGRITVRCLPCRSL